LNKYGICKSLGAEWGSEPTILYAVRDLEEDGYIEVVKIDKSARGGQPSKYYDVSLPGLAKVVSRLKDEAGDLSLLDQIANKYKTKIPQIFEQWPSLHKTGIMHVVRQNLAVWCDDLCQSLEDFPPRTGLDGRPIGRKRMRALLLSGSKHQETVRRYRKSIEEDRLQRVAFDVLCRGPAMDAEIVYLPVVRTRLGDKEYDNRAKHWFEAVRRSRFLREAVMQRLLEAKDDVTRWTRETDKMIQRLRETNSDEDS
jgi:hypothetical protein